MAQGYVQLTNLGANQPLVNGLTGQPVEAGSTFQAALYFAQDGIVDESQFVQLGPAAIFGRAGYFSGGTRSAPTATYAGFGMFQVRAWETAFGSTYEQALANTTPQGGRLALAGKSGIMRVDTANEFDPPEPLIGQHSVAVVGTHLSDRFTLNIVPEPSTFFLILAGVIGMLLYGRSR